MTLHFDSRGSEILPSLVAATRRGGILTNIMQYLLTWRISADLWNHHFLGISACTTLQHSFSVQPMLIWRCEKHEDAWRNLWSQVWPQKMLLGGICKTIGSANDQLVALIHPLSFKKNFSWAAISNCSFHQQKANIAFLFLQQVSSQEGHQTWFESCHVREIFPMEPAVTNQLSCFASSVRFRISGSLPLGTWPMNLPKRGWDGYQKWQDR